MSAGWTEDTGFAAESTAMTIVSKEAGRQGAPLHPVSTPDGSSSDCFSPDLHIQLDGMSLDFPSQVGAS